MMYTSRVHKFTVKNTSTIQMHYNCKIVSAENGKIDSGFFTVLPHNGTVNPNCEETFTVRFSPTEVEEFNERLLVISKKNLAPIKKNLLSNSMEKQKGLSVISSLLLQTTEIKNLTSKLTTI
jgi:hydrocephalus-inducing protein